MSATVPDVATANGVFKKLLRVSAGADAEYPETHVCDKTQLVVVQQVIILRETRVISTAARLQ
jgi:hypothetical protein